MKLSWGIKAFFSVLLLGIVVQIFFYFIIILLYWFIAVSLREAVCVGFWVGFILGGEVIFFWWVVALIHSAIQIFVKH